MQAVDPESHGELLGQLVLHCMNGTKLFDSSEFLFHVLNVSIIVRNKQTNEQKACSMAPGR